MGTTEKLNDLLIDNDIAYCPECDEEYSLPEDAKQCPICGEDIDFY